jgi:hypothetical protein
MVNEAFARGAATVFFHFTFIGTAQSSTEDLQNLPG